MNKIAVIYKSKYGSTKKYAEWIANEIGADLIEVSRAHNDIVSKYDTIIYGGGLYEDRISGVSFITKNYEALKDKNIIVYSVGLGSTDNKDGFKPLIDKNFNESMSKNIRFYHYRGGIDYGKLNFMDKFAMKLFYKFIARKKPEDISEEARMMLNTYGKDIDYTNKDAIELLVRYVRSID